MKTGLLIQKIKRKLGILKENGKKNTWYYYYSNKNFLCSKYVFLIHYYITISVIKQTLIQSTLQLADITGNRQVY